MIQRNLEYLVSLRSLLDFMGHEQVSLGTVLVSKTPLFYSFLRFSKETKKFGCLHRCLEESFLLWINFLTQTVRTAIRWCVTCVVSNMSIRAYWTVTTLSVPAACAVELWTAGSHAPSVGKNLLM